MKHIIQNNNHPKWIIKKCKSSVDIPSSVRRVVKFIALFAVIALCSLLLLNSFVRFAVRSDYSIDPIDSDYDELDGILRNASMEKKTVIITTLNDAWAQPDSIFDLFMKSFDIGKYTKGLLKHLVVICMDGKAYSLCSSSHPHCYRLRTKGVDFTNEAFFMSPNYLEMMWTRIQFLGSVLEMGYNFVFTDTDIMWLRNPFNRFFSDTDLQIACDYWNGNSYDLNNFPNGGFKYVRSNKRTIKFYKYWHSARLNYPGLHDQDVFNIIKYDSFVEEIGLKIRFLNTTYFGGFCQASQDLNKVCTMHANCCVGLNNKVNDLTILLEDWKRFTLSLSPLNPDVPWSVPQNCSTFRRISQHKHNISDEV